MFRLNESPNLAQNNKHMSKLFTSAHLKNFYFGYLIFLLAGLTLIIFIPYGDEVILLNKVANPLLDNVALFFSNLGLGIIFIIPISITLFTRFYYSLSALFILIFTGIITALFKQALFHGKLRPVGLLGIDSFIHTIPEFDYHTMNTFPSGHSITGFALIFFIALTLKNRRWNLILLMVGLLIAISRVYLLQHFFADTYIGSLLGLIAAYLGFYVTKRIFKNNTLIMSQNLSILWNERIQTQKKKTLLDENKPQRVLPLTFSSAFFFKSSNLR